jgi:hypothetical protein
MMFDLQALPKLNHISKSFAKFHQFPIARISIESSIDLVEDWIRAILATSKIQSPIYLRMSNFWTMGWTQVDVKDLDKFLVAIWHLDKSVQIVVGGASPLENRNCSSLLVLWEEEYYIESLIKLPQLIPDSSHLEE